MVLDASLLNAQHPKKRIKGKWRNPGREKEWRPPLPSGRKLTKGEPSGRPRLRSTNLLTYLELLQNRAQKYESSRRGMGKKDLFQGIYQLEKISSVLFAKISSWKIKLCSCYNLLLQFSYQILELTSYSSGTYQNSETNEKALSGKFCM